MSPMVPLQWLVTKIPFCPSPGRHISRHPHGPIQHPVPGPPRFMEQEFPWASVVQLLPLLEVMALLGILLPLTSKAPTLMIQVVCAYVIFVVLDPIKTNILIIMPVSKMGKKLCVFFWRINSIFIFK